MPLSRANVLAAEKTIVLAVAIAATAGKKNAVMIAAKIQNAVKFCGFKNLHTFATDLK